MLTQGAPDCRWETRFVLCPVLLRPCMGKLFDHPVCSCRLGKAGHTIYPSSQSAPVTSQNGYQHIWDVH